MRLGPYFSDLFGSDLVLFGISSASIYKFWRKGKDFVQYTDADPHEPYCLDRAVPLNVNVYEHGSI